MLPRLDGCKQALPAFVEPQLTGISPRSLCLEGYEETETTEGFVIDRLPGARSRNRTGMACLRPRDFKSLVSTNFTIRAYQRGEAEASRYRHTRPSGQVCFNSP